MHIVLIINTMGGGGAEKTLQTLANSWIKSHRASKVTIVCTDHSESAYQLNEGVETTALKSGKLVKTLGRLPAMFFQSIELAHRLKRLRPDVCISSLTRANLVHLLSTILLKTAPSIICEQTASFTYYKTGQSYPNRWVCALIRTIYPLSDAIVAASTFVGNDLINAGVPVQKVHTIYNPVSFGIPLNTDRERLSKRRIITIGRLSPEKDHATLLRAFAIVHKEVPDATLTIVGQGPLESQARALITELELNHCVELPGWDPHPDRRLRDSDLFVLTSTSEGFGVVLVEALACGLPVISTDCPGGPREILEDGAIGALVPVGDPEHLAKEIIRHLELPAHDKQEISSRSYRRARDFSVDTITDQYCSVIETTRKHFLEQKQS